MRLTPALNLHRLTLAAALFAGAMVLWLSTGAAGHAATATQTQATQAAVNKTISWGSVTGCTQSMGTADFGALAAGASSETSAFHGCVTSNATWGVSAAGTGVMTNSAEGTTIPNSSLVVRSVAAGLPAGATTSCNDTNTTCTLDSSRSVVAGAGRGSTGFDYKYQLTVPSSAPGGSYTGGQVTLTAAN